MSLEHIQDAKEKQKDNEQQVRDLARRLGVQISCFNCADLCAKLAAANEELSAIDAAMDKVDLPTRQDDFALTRVGRLLSLQDWWKDYAECTQKAVERAEAAERERDAAQAEAAALRKACMAALEPAGDAPDEVRAQLRAALATPSTAGESLRPTMAEAAAAVSQAEQNIRARLDALPSTAGERWKVLERVCNILFSIQQQEELGPKLTEALDALAALEKGE